MDAWKETVWNQFGAALDMLENTIPACPDDLWDDRSHPPPYWHIVYHTLFYTDLYLSESEGAFKPAPFHTANAQFLGEMPFPPHKAETPDWTPSKSALVAYSEHCRSKLKTVIHSITEEKLVQKTAFYWLPFSNRDLLLYNLRHVQHHTAQLALLVRQAGHAAPGWIGITKRSLTES